MKVAEWTKKNRADRQLERAAREGTLQVRRTVKKETLGQMETEQTDSWRERPEKEHFK